MKAFFYDSTTLGDYKAPGGDDLPAKFQISFTPEDAQEATLLALWNGKISAIFEKPNAELEIHRVGNGAEGITFEFVEKKK